MKNLIRSATILLACASCVSGAEMAAQEPASPTPSTETTVDAPVPAGTADVPDLIPDQSAATESADGQLMPDGMDATESDAVLADETSSAVLQAPTEKTPYTRIFRASAAAVYDDNIFFSHHDKKGDLIWSVTPGLTLGMGDVLKRKESFAVLDYDATAKFYTDHSDLDTVDHVASLLGQWTGAKLTLGGFAKFRDITDVSNEVGERINQKVYEFGANATYAWSEVTKLGAELSEHISDYSGDNVDTRETDLRLWVDHDMTLLTKLGLGVTVGEVDLSRGASQTFEQLLVRGTYAIDTKVQALLEAGGELREVDHGSTDANGVFALGVTYTPYDLLKMKLQGYRRVQPSITDPGANTTVTGVSLGFTYLFLERFEFAASGAYERSKYETVSGSSEPARDDDYFTGRIEQNYIITKNMRVGVFAQFRTNRSSDEDRSFDDRQVGLIYSLAF